MYRYNTVGEQNLFMQFHELPPAKNWQPSEYQNITAWL